MEKKRTGNFCRGKFSWIGYPDDLGVKNVNGRMGAKGGPAQFGELFKKLKGRLPVHDALKAHAMVEMGSDLETNYGSAIKETEAAIKALHLDHDTLIAVGGSHDYAYPWIKAFRNMLGEKAKIGCINLDAHFDLRTYKPLMTSGSPFRRLIDERVLDGSKLIEFGIQSHCNGNELWDYAKNNRVEIVAFERLRNGRAVSEFEKALRSLRGQCDRVLISLDLDSLSYAFAPGVSAPQAEGFTASEVFQMLEIAGSDKKVTSLGIFELAPALDLHDLTSRLAAQSAWHFLSKKLI